MTEEEHLQLIEGKLEKAIEGIKEEMKLNDKDIAQLQELYWENYSDFDEYGYEEYENRQQMFNHANFRSRNMKTLHMYKRMQDSPYFARVDFVFTVRMSRSAAISESVISLKEREACHSYMIGVRLYPVFFMIMMREEHHMWLRQELSRVR